MPKGARLLLNNACYHIITRGNHKQQVFCKDKDYLEFLSRLKRYKRKHGFKLYGFCLMPNHLHIVGEPEDTRNLSKLMQGLLRSYTSYFNKKYKKAGHLWQNRFKSKVIVKDRYLVDCIHYIELNPIRAKMINTAVDYKWSSYKERNFDEGINGNLLDELCI